MDELGIPFTETSSVPAWNIQWELGPEPSSTDVLVFAGWILALPRPILEG